MNKRHTINDCEQWIDMLIKEEIIRNEKVLKNV